MFEKLFNKFLRRKTIPGTLYNRAWYDNAHDRLNEERNRVVEFVERLKALQGPQAEINIEISDYARKPLDCTRQMDDAIWLLKTIAGPSWKIKDVEVVKFPNIPRMFKVTLENCIFGNQIQSKKLSEWPAIVICLLAFEIRLMYIEYMLNALKTNYDTKVGIVNPRNDDPLVRQIEKFLASGDFFV